MKVFVNINTPGVKKPTERKLIEVEKVKEFPATILVRLPDGNKIIRRKSRDLPKEESNV
jgi:hypothetical protein